ncbi:hypothetical protein B4U79_04566, partial [Dinothrombium tinctorium]
MSENCVRHTRCPNVICDLCSYECTIDNLGVHFESLRHKDRYKRLHDHLYLLALPYPTDAHLEALTSAVYNFVSDALKTEDFEKRFHSVQRFDQIVKSLSNTCTVRVYGSTINGFGLKNSNVNVELIRNGEEIVETPGEFLKKLADFIQQVQTPNFYYSEVIKEFDIKIPRLHFIEVVPRTSRLQFELSITAEKSFKASNLLLKYSLFDERAHILGLALRKWAKIFRFDNQESGTWPPHTFPILVIHYLQQIQPPVLPCFHEMQTEKAPTSETTESSEDDASTDVNEDEFDLIKHKWVSRNTKSVGELWIGLFRYYIFDFLCGVNVVSIRKTKKMDTHADKGWGTKILAIEDPTRPSLNLSRSVGSFQIYECFMRMWRATFKYLMTPSIRSQNNKLLCEPLFAEQNFDFVVRPTLSKAQKLMQQLNRVNENMLNEKTSANGEEADSDEESNAIDSNGAHIIFKSMRLISEYGLQLILKSDIEEVRTSLQPNIYHFNFDFEKHKFYQKPRRFCRLCHKHDHLQTNCPVEKLPELVPLPEVMPEKHLSKLSRTCDELYDYYKLTPEDEARHNFVVNSLKNVIVKDFPDSKLELFGSTKNGFGAWDCDLDICLTFESNTTGEGIDQAEIIVKLASILSKHPDVEHLEPITQAKVPILKFKFKYHQHRKFIKFECDISLYNRLAIFNTRLLRTYCEIDDRVRKLGFIVKHFAKCCDVCDASRGSLSSYAYTLMTIHFLQQCHPPVVPVLQEIYFDDKKPERLIDGWNTWFYEDHRLISQVWPHWRTNKLSVAELFVGFLRYYTETFSFENNVVCVNQFLPLTKLKKMWTGKKIAIEDPFLLTHNLGQGVDDHMAAFIKTALCKGRNLIGRPPDELPPRYKHWGDYFFDRDRLTEGTLPTGRGCRLCGKIGHKVADCPIKREMKKANRHKKDKEPKPPLQQPEQKQQPKERLNQNSNKPRPQNSSTP